MPNRVKFMILDLIDLRNNQWVPRREKAQSSKSKAQIHAEARKEEQELLLRQAAERNINRGRYQSNDYRNNNNRGGRGSNNNRNSNAGRGGRQGPSKPPPVQDLRPFNPRGNTGRANSNLNRMNAKNTLSQNRRPNNDNISSSSSNDKTTMSLDKMKKSLKSTVKEYLMIEDLNELKECLKELPNNMNKESYFIGTCADIAINEKESNRRKIYKLMEYITKDKVVSDDQIADGLAPMFEALDDVMIDSPLAGKWIGELIGNCVVGNDGNKEPLVEKCFRKINNEKHLSKVEQGVNAILG